MSFFSLSVAVVIVGGLFEECMLHLVNMTMAWWHADGWPLIK